MEFEYDCSCGPEATCATCMFDNPYREDARRYLVLLRRCMPIIGTLIQDNCDCDGKVLDEKEMQILRHLFQKMHKEIGEEVKEVLKD